MADSNQIKELKKRLLDIEKEKELQKAEEDLLRRNMQSSGSRERGLIEAKYSTLKDLVDEDNIVSSAKVLPNLGLNVSEQTSPHTTINILRWEVFTLDIDSGKANIAGKHHNFDKNKPPYKCYLTLLRKRIENPSDGEVSYEQLTQTTGIEDRNRIRLIIRNLRKNLGINNKENPKEDVFQATGKGFRLVVPLHD